MENNAEIKVSVIVPIYNAGEQLYRCLDSIINQTLKEIEIILVLDCPQDGSDKIAESYQQKDNRIIILKNEQNLHIGESRNRGLEIAKGEYVHFSDHDDYRELFMLEEMYKEAKKEDLDMLVSTPVSIQKGKISIENKDKESRDREYMLRHLLRGGYEDEKHPWSYYCYIHNILYKRELIAKNDIKFVNTKYITPEDVIFNIECLLSSKKALETKKIYYYHAMLESSEGHRSNYYSGQKRISGYAYINDLLKSTGTLEQYKSDFYSNVAKNYILLLFRAIECNHSLNEFFKCIKIYRKLDYTKEAFENYKQFINKQYSGIRYLILRILVCLVLFGR